MLFQRINRSNPEKVFVVAYNSYATAALTNGQSATWDFVTDKDGVGITKPLARTTNQGFGVVGIVASASIASGDYGLIQVYGYHSATRCRTVSGGAVTIAPGVPLALAAVSAFCLENFATHFTGSHIWPCAFAMSTLTNQWTTVAKVIFVKAL